MTAERERLLSLLVDRAADVVLYELSLAEAVLRRDAVLEELRSLPDAPSTKRLAEIAGIRADRVPSPRSTSGSTRERAVPCAYCAAPTFNDSGVCDDEPCVAYAFAAREQRRRAGSSR